MNLKEMADSLGIEEDELRSLLDIFIDATKADLETLRDAIASGVMERIVAAAHSIKGASLNFGFNEISEEARRIEMDARHGILEGSAELAESISKKLDSLILALG